MLAKNQPITYNDPNPTRSSFNRSTSMHIHATLGRKPSAVVASTHNGQPKHATIRRRHTLWNKWTGNFRKANQTGTSEDSLSTWKSMDHLKTHIGKPLITRYFWTKSNNNLPHWLIELAHVCVLCSSIHWWRLNNDCIQDCDGFGTACFDPRFISGDDIVFYSMARAINISA